MDSVVLKDTVLHNNGLLIKSLLSILIIGGWMVVIWKSLWPVISIIEIIQRYKDEKLQQQELQMFDKCLNQTIDNRHYDNEDGGLDSDDKLIALKEIEESMLILSACFIMFTTIISILGLIGVNCERISMSFMYGIFISMALMFTITQAIQDPITWMDNAGMCFGFLLLLTIINVSIWCYIRMLFWKRQQSNLIDQGDGSMNHPPSSPSSFQNDNFEPNLTNILIK